MSKVGDDHFVAGEQRRRWWSPRGYRSFAVTAIFRMSPHIMIHLMIHLVIYSELIFLIFCDWYILSRWYLWYFVTDIFHELYDILLSLISCTKIYFGFLTMWFTPSLIYYFGFLTMWFTPSLIYFTFRVNPLATRFYSTDTTDTHTDTRLLFNK